MTRTHPASRVLLTILAFGTFLLGASRGYAATAQSLTPILLSVQNAPIPFAGSDGHTHLVYELWLTNFSSAPTTIRKVVISDGARTLQTLDTSEVAARLQAAGARKSSGTMAAGAVALLFIHIVLPKDTAVPEKLNHQVTIHVAAAPPGHQDMTASLDGTALNHRRVRIIGAPLRGGRYISADSCCDAARHTRAALAVNGAVWVAQRYAVDWEQLNDQNRIYVGPKQTLASYKIYGQPVIAVANGLVVTAINDQPDQPPGKFPTGLTLDQADGNAVILDLGGGDYAMYAHMQRGSVRVRAGDKVTKGDVIGLVGNSGNTIAPHLHFQMMDSPLSLASNGLPYEIDSFQIIGHSPGTAAFDEAEANGSPLAITPASAAPRVSDSLPLDQQIISFSPDTAR